MQKHQADPALWVDRYGDYLYKHAILKVNHHETAEDLVYETFASGIAGLSAFKGEAHEKTWLTRILNHKIIDYYRAKGKSEQRELPDFFNEDGHWKSDMQPRDWGNDPESLLNRKGFEEVLRQCLSRLPQTTRLVFIRKVIDDEESAAICKELEISSSNYWVLLHRARLAMRTCIEQNWIL